ncbi:uncharacterized protein M421DRAFT_329130 [Didymella exigua CBS 183.55]|uniref:Uncharacterized protein n=1 Tax=Didymella exigua CBS 183.55 TaxID=1150837 RepID=A0A6A5R7R5_9PLEO|nr:uncharacterized protein M421DRAFT_329130 [Didymella exigua CBS 183.55]KAF1923208.1 hypothetical protein M421DRAFT_329130 [Didymella exigua CBS 183.55]
MALIRLGRDIGREARLQGAEAAQRGGKAARPASVGGPRTVRRDASATSRTPVGFARARLRPRPVVRPPRNIEPARREARTRHARSCLTWRVIFLPLLACALFLWLGFSWLDAKVRLLSRR